MDNIWETFDGLFRVVNAQARKVETLEQRVSDLENRLAQKGATCGKCEDTGLLSGDELCTCPAAALVIGPEDELTSYPSAEADDRVALRLA